MTRLLLLIEALFAAAMLVGEAHVAQAAILSTLRSAVFKIQVTSNEPNFSYPWKRMPSTQSSGTGFYIGEGRILTNAHVVANASFITVLRDGDSKPTPAFVRHIGHDCDLAILEVQDPATFDGVEAMRFGGLPKLRSPVSTIGFPTGGEQLSITEGVVSRVSYRRYVHHGSSSHLLVQVDSAINPGNSGGPVVQGRSVVGVAFQSYTRAENTGYIIPVPVVRRFLKDIEDDHYDGHPNDGLTTVAWTMLNPGTRAFHGLAASMGGVKIAHVAPWAQTAQSLRAGDIILALDDREIGVDGKLDFQGERVDFRTVFDLKLKGEKASFRIAREGRIMNVVVDIAPDTPHYVPQEVYAKRPRYLVYGGLVFTALSRSYLKSWGSQWYKDAPILLRYLHAFADYDAETARLHDIIVLAKRLPDEVNAYATSNLYGVVTAVDGRPVASIAAMARALDEGTDEHVIFDFHGKDEPLVLSRRAVAARQEIINRRYGVVPDRWLSGPEDDGAIRLEVAR